MKAYQVIGKAGANWKCLTVIGGLLVVMGYGMSPFFYVPAIAISGVLSATFIFMVAGAGAQ